MSETETGTTWLSPDQLGQMRAQMPIVYVEAVPLCPTPTDALYW